VASVAEILSVNSTAPGQLHSFCTHWRPPDSNSTVFGHSIQGHSERPLRELPITQSRESDHRRSVATNATLETIHLLSK
jgi:hypothetical protein